MIMENRILFSEKQKFKQWWLWLILIGLNILLIFGVFIQVVGGNDFGTNPISDAALIMLTIFTLFMMVLLMSLQLVTQIKEDGIYVRFFPFHFKFKHYAWEDIKKSFVRKYSPLIEYGGWGLRFGIFGKGIAYNVSGNRGLQIELNDNRKVLIGTKKPDELKSVLEKMGKLINY